MEKSQSFLISLVERILSITAFIFPFFETMSYFGPKVFLGTENVILQDIYLNSLEEATNFYTENNLLIFIFMVWLFIICSRGLVRLTKYVRFNIIQAILLNIICSCVGLAFSFLPIVLRESLLGLIFSNFLFLSIVLILGYCSLLIAYHRYPELPIVTEAAKLQVRKGG